MNAIQLKLREIFEYNPVTGVFKNINAPDDKLAGTITKTGMQQVYFEGRSIPVGVLIVAYMTGVIPSFTGRYDNDNKNTAYDNIFVSDIRCANQMRKSNENKSQKKVLTKSELNNRRIFPLIIELHKSFHNATVGYDPLPLNHEHKLINN